MVLIAARRSSSVLPTNRHDCHRAHIEAIGEGKANQQDAD